MDSTRCKSCGKLIVFMPTLKGKFMPVNLESVYDTDIFFDSKKHKSHFADCPKADSFRKKTVIVPVQQQPKFPPSFLVKDI